MGDDDIAYHHWLPSWYAEAQFSVYCLKKRITIQEQHITPS
jgi:hypothetical protein